MGLLALVRSGHPLVFELRVTVRPAHREAPAECFANLHRVNWMVPSAAGPLVLASRIRLLRVPIQSRRFSPESVPDSLPRVSGRPVSAPTAAQRGPADFLAGRSVPRPTNRGIPPLPVSQDAKPTRHKEIDVLTAANCGASSRMPTICESHARRQWVGVRLSYTCLITCRNLAPSAASRRGFRLRRWICTPGRFRSPL